MTLSQTRQRALTADIPIVQRLYQAACAEWGPDVVEADLRTLWTLRCMWGVTNQLPFGTGMQAKNLKEFLYVARTLCRDVGGLR